MNIKRTCFKFAPIIMITLILMSCSNNKYNKYQSDFFGAFDTYTILIGYAKSQEEYQKYHDIVYEEMMRQHKLFDIYNNYTGINNIKTINDNAGIAPVEVSDELIEFLLFGIEAYHLTDGMVNMAAGSVLRTWHEYRTEGSENPEEAQLPPMDYLIEMSQHMNIEDVVINIEEKTVYLRDPIMSLDVGSLAKGYAVEQAMNTAKEQGFISALISAGGNIKANGKPLDSRDRWGVGIQDPESEIIGAQNIIDEVFITDVAVVTSGGYERNYEVDGKLYHHIIDLKTLMPPEHYSSATIVTPDSGYADMYSTVIFLLTYEEAIEYLKNHEEVEGLWIYPDNSLEATEGYKAISRHYSSYGSKD